jgi:hypothetical protein
MGIRMLSVATLVLALATMFAAPAAAQTNTGTLQDIPVVGTIAGGGGSFTGELDITRFVVRNGQLFAIGTLTGTLTDAAGNVIGTVLRNVLLPVTQANGTCEILHLELGPLTLDLLGLQVNLSKIVLDIDAQAGPGNLLGNLLCAIAGLLDQTPTNALANLLNQLLGLLS